MRICTLLLAVCVCGMASVQGLFFKDLFNFTGQTVKKVTDQYLQTSNQLLELLLNPVWLKNLREITQSTIRKLETLDEMYFQLGVDTIDKSSTAGLKQSFSGAKEESVKLGKPTRYLTAVIKEISKTIGLTVQQLGRQIESLIKGLGIDLSAVGIKSNNCRKQPSIRCDNGAKYRTVDGSCNNLEHPLWGHAFIPMRRFLEPVYDDNVSDPRIRGRGNQPLPSARAVSRILHVSDHNVQPSQAVTHMVMQWGQFLDHDLTSTPIQTGANGASATCCEDDVPSNVRSQLPMDVSKRDICFPIKIPQNDNFRPRTCLNFVRSVHVSKDNCKSARVEQLNQITAFLDGSQVYGSSNKEQRGLRTLNGGLLKTSENNLLPRNERQNCRLTKKTDFCFKAGDVRVNEQMALASLHTVWMREHNRIAKELTSVRPNWGDETLFQEARKIVSAELQHITYREFLPVVLDNDVMQELNLVSSPGGFSDSYDKNTDPSIRNSFATAAYRFGHSLVQSMFSQLAAGYVRQGKHILTESFGNTSNILDNRGDGINTYIRGLVTDRAQKTDAYMSTQLTQHLFEDRNGNRLDLASLNIQRGRDHGLPGYNRFRKWCGLSVAQSFDGLVDHPADARQKFRDVYSHPDDIDLFSGGVSENSIRGGLVGPTFACLLSRQFKVLKEGDRFWYERNDPITGFTEGQLNAIKQWGTLSRVLCDNTDIQEIQKLPFNVPTASNRRESCTSQPSLSLNQWSENPTDSGIAPEPVGAEWGPWSKWSPCFNGMQFQTRQCLVNTGCNGNNFQTRSCKTNTWGPWGQWTPCIDGSQQRTRSCSGQTCIGLNTERRTCSQSAWGQWGRWSSCRSGQASRQRVCRDPSGGIPICTGNNSQSKSCRSFWSQFLNFG